MAITHGLTTRQALADQVTTSLDGGALVFLTAGDAEVARCILPTPAAQPADASAIAVFNAIPDDTAPTGGTIAKFELRTSAEGTVLSGTVTAPGGGGDLEISSLDITGGASGDDVGVSTLSYQASV